MFKEGDIVTHSDYPNDINFIITYVLNDYHYHCQALPFRKGSHTYSMARENLRHICEKKQGIFDMFKDYM